MTEACGGQTHKISALRLQILRSTCVYAPNNAPREINPQPPDMCKQCDRCSNVKSHFLNSVHVHIECLHKDTTQSVYKYIHTVASAAYWPVVYLAGRVGGD